MKTKQTVKALSRWLIHMAFTLAASLSFGPSYAVEVVTYFHNDIAGTPIVATDANGNVVWKESYLPYGDKLNNSAASSDNKLGFTGKPYDGNTGLSYMGARYYDPLLGRFMGVDPVRFDEENIHSFNRYAYGNNNPYKFVDPDGREAVTMEDIRILSPEKAANAAQFWADKQVQTGNSAYAIPGAIAALWSTHAEEVGMVLSTARGGSLVRFGKGPETAASLAEQAAKAEAAGFPHGVSTRLKPKLSNSDSAHRCALKCDVEQSFEVKQTGNDPRHHTVVLPKPVTESAAEKFNKTFSPKE